MDELRIHLFGGFLLERLDVELFETTFESAVAGGRDPQARRRDNMTVLRGCVDLYRGDFIEGFSDDWLLIEQEYYRVRYVTALRRLLDATKAEGAYDEALAHARRLTHHDPLSEDVHQGGHEALLPARPGQ
jgi:two-component SAPR family response regulator